MKLLPEAPGGLGVTISVFKSEFENVLAEPGLITLVKFPKV